MLRKLFNRLSVVFLLTGLLACSSDEQVSMDMPARDVPADNPINSTAPNILLIISDDVGMDVTTVCPQA